ncbi:MAG: molecular chaperone HtpG [Anaerovoracaceae bacterium]|nr:molecular chaperone HtpG [Bacillota bacterium]MDD7733355.1 molecular chaperone HtpG [Bacillota bacterium]MDY5906375.1 molecular chaperone HtpG [Anaerovoracaceae bacterium]
MAKKQFKAESKKLLDMMINSIYTNKEIFLRELISNASDAIDKLYYEGPEGMSRDDFYIALESDFEERTLSIIDNGIGMNKEELEKNLGTIARSGSLEFKKSIEDGKDVDIIGQFGVGFYSAFMVADKVTVISRKYGEEECWQWESEGADGYTILESAMVGHGTRIILHIKNNTPDENYDEYLFDYKLRSLVKKYSDYIRYPIQMEVEKSRPKEGGEENQFETYTDIETLNSMIPIWKKSKSEITDEQYAMFYKEKFYAQEEPLRVIHYSVEGASSFTALLFIPKRPPFNYFSPDYEKGLQLYSSGVLIMDHCADLVPDYYGFVRGIVDSQDLDLNISRETLQQNRQVKNIAKNIEKKIKNELMSMLNTDREVYEKFFKDFGLSIKFGLYNSFGQLKDELQDLLLFYSSSEKKLVTLSEYASRMKEDQKYVYYATGKDISHIEKLPQIEILLDKGYEVLYMTDEVDDFLIRMIRDFQDKPFRSAAGEDLGLEETEEEKQEFEKKKDESKDMLEKMKEMLGGRVKEVRISQRLKSNPVCLAVDGDVSIEMERVMNSMPIQEKVESQKVLEINPDHPVFNALTSAFKSGDDDKLRIFTSLLYDQAALIGGLTVEDPVAFSNHICDLMK